MEEKKEKICDKVKTNDIMSFFTIQVSFICVCLFSSPNSISLSCSPFWMLTLLNRVFVYICTCIYVCCEHIFLVNFTCSCLEEWLGVMEILILYVD